MKTNLARFTERSVALAKKGTVGPVMPSVKQGKGGSADHVFVAVHALREHPSHSYRQFMDYLHGMHRIVRRLGLTVEKLPNFTTVCHAKNDLYMPHWRRFLDLTTTLQDLGDIQTVDASGFDRIAASRKYANRTIYTFNAKKATVFGYCETVTILDVHCTTNRPHDTQIGRQIMARNFEELSILTADKGYDTEALRRYAQAHTVKPVFKHRNQSALNCAENQLQDGRYLPSTVGRRKRLSRP